MNESYHVSQSLQSGLDRLFGLIPEIIGVILLLVLGCIFALIIKKVTKKILRKLRFDRAVNLSPAGNYVTRVVEHPTDFVGRVAYWVVMLAFISFAISSLNVPALNQMITGVYRYIPNVIAAILIFLVASTVTAGAEAFVRRVFRSSPLSKVLAAVIPAVTMSIAFFMILNQLRIAPEIVNITYSALMGSIALGLALAFGLGGRDVASQILGKAYESAQNNSGSIKSELADAKDRTAQRAKQARDNLNRA